MNFIKPKFWDLKKPNLLSKILIIFTFPLIINNFLAKLKTKEKFKNIKIICIGNIYLGGTGKTPSVIKVYNLLKKLDFKVATAKKFYKSQLDEQILLKERTNLILASSRKSIIKKAIELNNDFLIFDDGLQDKNIDYGLKVVCFDAKNWIGNGQLIPAGPLREKLTSLKKYDAVFLKNGKENTKEIIKMINPNIKVFNTYYEITNYKKFKPQTKYLTFSGIGNPYGFKSFLLENNFNIIDEIIYPDHFNYRTRDIENIKKRANDLNAKIITTEKDFVKILETDRSNIDYIEIGLKIHNEESLKNFIISKINEKN